MHSDIGGDVFIALYNKTLFLIPNNFDHKKLSTEPAYLDVTTKTEPTMVAFAHWLSLINLLPP